MKECGLVPEDYWWYLELRHTVPSLTADLVWVWNDGPTRYRHDEYSRLHPISANTEEADFLTRGW